MELNVLPRNEEGKYDFASLPSEFKYYLYLKMLVSRAGSLLDDSNRYTPSSALSQAKHRMSRSDQSRYPVLEFFNDLSTDEQDQLLEAYYSESLRHECIDPFNFMPNDQDFPDFASESLPKADIFLAIERDIHRGYLAKVAKEYENSENAGVFDFIVTELQTQLGQRLENASYYNYVLLQELAFIFYPESQHFFDEDHSLVLQESGSVFSKDVVKELLRDEDFRGKITQFLSDYLKTINSFSDTSNVGAVKSLNRRIEQLSQQVESPSCSIM